MNVVDPKEGESAYLAIVGVCYVANRMEAECRRRCVEYAPMDFLHCGVSPVITCELKI